MAHIRRRNFQGQNIDFGQLLRDNLGAGRFLIARHLLNPRSCNKCGRLMKLQRSGSYILGVVWRCRNKLCKRKLSARIYAYLRIGRLSMGEIVYLLFKSFPNLDPYLRIMGETGLSKTSIIKLRKFWLNLLRAEYTNMPVLGGVGHVVEVDEALFARRKYNRGRLVREIWVLGLRERDRQKRSIPMIVDDRSAATLQTIVRQRVRTGSIIMTDMWASYQGLEQYGYTHGSVNHSQNFINPDPLVIPGRLRNQQIELPIHTQSVESYWAQLRWVVRRRKGIFRTHLQKVIWEADWWLRNKTELIEAVEDLIYNWGH